MSKFSRTIIISCAGMGNRLGLGNTKALVEVDGKPLIIRHLEQLEKEKDIRVVVGYQAEKVIKVVNDYRRDIVFVFNHEYRNTGTGASVALAARYANEYILTLDGDLLVHPDDMQTILDSEYEFVSGGRIETDDPWMIQTYEKDGEKFASAFSKDCGEYEWNGICQIKSTKVQNGRGHVFQLIEPYLPIRILEARTKEIDTMNDYERAEKWIRNMYNDSGEALNAIESIHLGGYLSE